MMSIKNFKKKMIGLSLLVILAGAFVSIAGFGLTGFNYDRLKETADHNVWYQTIHVNSSDNLWYGIDLGNEVHLFVLGDSD
jgi:hypothetical protein